MIESARGEALATSQDDEKLYEYTNEDAPEDVVINIGNQSLMISAPHTLNDPHRLEVGDRRRGPYYIIECVGKMPGLMPLYRVDAKRLGQVNKIRRIRVGDEEEDWIKAARLRSIEVGAEQPPAPKPASAHLTPLQRAARGI